jgi:hypothetical protein
MISWLIDLILSLLGIVLFLVVLGGVFVPLESLGWWAGWGGKKQRQALLDLEKLDSEKPAPDLPPTPEMDLYVLYLSGIGIASSDGLAPDELDFIRNLQTITPGLEVITDVFPYSINNNPLTGERLLSPLWKKIREIQKKKMDSLISGTTITLRNMLQVVVSADPRYGPIYSMGVAEEIARSLANHGYRLGSHKPIYLIGYSGGGQVSVGVATYLTVMMDAPIHVVSIGGVISDDSGIKHVTKLTHHFGSKDFIQKVGEIMWAGRWSTMKSSDWNTVKAEGRITFHSMGPMNHMLKESYFDDYAKFDNGKSYAMTTAEAVKAAIVEP